MMVLGAADNTVTVSLVVFIVLVVLAVLAVVLLLARWRP